MGQSQKKVSESKTGRWRRGLEVFKRFDLPWFLDACSAPSVADHQRQQNQQQQPGANTRAPMPSSFRTVDTAAPAAVADCRRRRRCGWKARMKNSLSLCLYVSLFYRQMLPSSKNKSCDSTAILLSQDPLLCVFDFGLIVKATTATSAYPQLSISIGKILSCLSDCCLSLICCDCCCW